ncbi:MAG: pyridoxal phosphate-dependent aminotransferase [Pseudomonadota bacterium]
MNNPAYASKLPNVGTTIFTVMSQLAQQHGALNLSQGFPDFDPPQALMDRVTHHLKSGHNQYAPMTGLPELRQQIAVKIHRLYGNELDADSEITVTSGATEALFSAIQTVVTSGDEVIVFDPAYDSYEPAVTLAGGRTIHIPLTTPDFRIDWDRLGKAITSKTRLVIINSPHNPTGAVLDAADLDRLAEVLSRTDAMLLSDEVYEHIVFDQAKHHSVLTHSDLWRRSFVVSSFGKTYHATGWKIGYCVAPKQLSSEFRKVHQYNTFAVATPLQYALADFMSENEEHHLELPDFYQAKRDLFCHLVEPSRFSFVPTRGTYFQLLDYSAITDETDTDFANRLTKEIGVAAIPISVFCQEPIEAKLLRFCFAKDDDTLKKGAEILCQI